MVDAEEDTEEALGEASPATAITDVANPVTEPPRAG